MTSTFTKNLPKPGVLMGIPKPGTPKKRPGTSNHSSGARDPNVGYHTIKISTLQRSKHFSQTVQFLANFNILIIITLALF